MKKLILASAIFSLVSIQPAEASILGKIGKTVLLPVKVIGYVYGAITGSLVSGIYSGVEDIE